MIAATRAYLANLSGDGDRAIELAHQAEKLLPESIPRARAAVLLTLADAHFARDEMDSAGYALSQMLALGKRLDRPLLTVLAICDLANVKKVQGQLHKANDLYEQAHQLLLTQDGMQSRVRCALEVGLSDLLREWNEAINLTAIRRRRAPGTHWRLPKT